MEVDNKGEMDEKETGIVDIKDLHATVAIDLPHIHVLDVTCASSSVTITKNIESMFPEQNKTSDVTESGGDKRMEK